MHGLIWAGSPVYGGLIGVCDLNKVLPFVLLTIGDLLPMLCLLGCACSWYYVSGRTGKQQSPSLQTAARVASQKAGPCKESEGSPMIYHTVRYVLLPSRSVLQSSMVNPTLI